MVSGGILSDLCSTDTTAPMRVKKKSFNVPTCQNCSTIFECFEQFKDTYEINDTDELCARLDEMDEIQIRTMVFVLFSVLRNTSTREERTVTEISSKGNVAIAKNVDKSKYVNLDDALANGEYAIDTDRGKFSIMHKIGSGATAVVYVAVDEFDRLYAFKRTSYRKFLTSKSERIVRKNVVAISKFTRASIPFYVAKYYLIIADPQTDSIFTVMNYVKGKNLENETYDGPDFEKITFCLVTAVITLHQQGLAHCDIKPANIVYNEVTGVATLIDLDSVRGAGISIDKKALNESTIMLKYNGELAGSTKMYISPEMRTGLFVNFKTCDIWAMGITLRAIRNGSTPTTSDGPMQRMRELRWKYGSDNERDFFDSMVRTDVTMRITAEKIEEHPYFVELLNKYSYLDAVDVETPISFGTPVPTAASTGTPRPQGEISGAFKTPGEGSATFRPQPPDEGSATFKPPAIQTEVSFVFS